MQPPPRLDLGNPPPKPSASPPPPPPHFPPPIYREEAAPKAAPAKKGASGILPTLVTLGAFGGLVVLAWFAYQEGKSPVAEEDIPLISAEEESFKRAPENPGGEEIPHVDKEVYDSFRGDKPVAEAKKPVLSNEADQPIDRAFLKQFGNSDEEITGDTKQEAIAFGQPSAAPAAANAAASTEPVLEPKPLPLAKANETLPNTGGIQLEQPVPLKEDVVEAPAIPTIPALSGNSPEVVKKPELVKPQQSSAASKPKKPEPKKATIAEAAKKKVVPPKAALPAKGLRVQLGAFRSEQEAASEWRKVQGRFPTALKGKSMMVQKVEIPQKGTMYRLQAGPVSSRDEARSLCKKLVEAGQGCFLAK